MATTSTAPASPSTGTKPPLVISDRDIVFNCPNCQGELVVDCDGAGVTVPCSHCGQPLVIPEYQERPSSPAIVVAQPTVEPVDPPTPPAPPRHFDFTDRNREQLDRRFDELKHQLKENRSQDTEMRGHVNRATMELHRLQLKLKKLQDRHADINAEINALADWLDNDKAGSVAAP